MTPLDRVRRYVAAASTMPGAVVNNSADVQWITVDDLRAVLALVPVAVDPAELDAMEAAANALHARVMSLRERFARPAANP